jgi:hypothetical protein
MNARSVALAVFMAGGLVVPSASAAETTYCNAYITTLPYTINTQGHYCLNRNLSTAISTGNAITINTDFVVLDLNNFKLGGGAAGTASEAVGVYANERSNLTIRGGNIRGFAFGIVVQGTIGTPAQNIVVEDNVLDGNLKVGILVAAKAAQIRNNLVSNTGGSTSAVLFCGGGIALGIAQVTVQCGFIGDSAHVAGNTVSDTVGTTVGAGIYFNSVGSSSAVGNVVRNVTGTVSAGGIVEDNLTNTVCRDNIVQGAALPYQGCTLVGTTNHP